MKKRFFVLSLTVLMVLSVLPASALADESDGFYSDELATGYDAEWAASLKAIKETETTWNGHKYVRVETSMDWFAAKAYCENLGGHLVTITSYEEDVVVASLVKGGTKASYWLGATDEKEEGVWRWVTSEPWTYWGHMVTFDNYQDNENYMQMDRHHWGDEEQCGVWNDINYRNRIEGEEEFFSTENIGLILEFDYNGSKWAQPYLQQAHDLGLIPDCLDGADLTKQITRREFAAVAVKVYAALSDGAPAAPGAAFADCNDAEVLKAVAIGITNGTDSVKNLFSPDKNITREQCAAMLARAYKAAALEGWTLAADKNYEEQFRALFTMPALFADDASISAFAKDSVYFMAANGIINGVGDNKFAPKNGTSADEAVGYGLATREQALKIAVGMVVNLS